MKKKEFESIEKDIMSKQRKKWKIYAWIYIPENKIVYIGQTCRKNIYDRSGKGMQGYKGCPKFWHAICKYGCDSFECNILEDSITSQKECDIKEQLYINQYHTIEKGYNIEKGGHVGVPSRKKKVVQKRWDIKNKKLIDVCEYNSQLEAAEQNYISTVSMRYAIKNNIQINGYYWFSE